MRNACKNKEQDRECSDNVGEQKCPEKICGKRCVEMKSTDQRTTNRIAISSIVLNYLPTNLSVA